MQPSRSTTWSRPTPACRSFDIVHDHTLVGPILSASYPELPVVTTNHGPFDG